MKKINRIMTAALFLLAACSACTKPWDDHNQSSDPNLKANLYEAISKTSGLGKFSELLVKSGYDKIIASS
ncbi:MAG: hypothetical protein JST39_07015, partial [Bacteroidetes bacterium]|nr:hypothetical protein [Bacteroidota bacterium]